MRFMRSGKPMSVDSVAEPSESFVLTEEEKRIVSAGLVGVDTTEVYSLERVNANAARFGLLPGSSLDLTNGLDLSTKD